MRLDPNLIYPGKDPDFTFPEEGSDLMTYQELLVEFSKRRVDADTDFPKLKVQDQINALMWIMQALLEKLRDQMEGPP